jgi:2-aminoadipate transaminase
MAKNVLSKKEFSNIVNSMKPSAIDAILKAIGDPEMISFGGGLPNPESFPVDDVKKVFNELISTSGRQMLQYGATEGLRALSVTLAKRMKEQQNIDCDPSEIVQTTGSQEALYILGKILANPGDYVISEAPTYLGAITAFKASGIRMIGVEMDQYGMKIDALKSTLKKYPHPKFIYVLPNFQNPSGISMNTERRKEFLEVVSENGITVLEDDPYGSLRYSGSPLPALKSMDKEDNVIYLGTFSKVLAPGFRLGYTIAPQEIVDKMKMVKQALDLASSTISEYIAEAYISGGYIDRWIPNVIELYRKKRDLMIKSLEEYLPSEVEFTRPDGGMFIWVTKKGGNTDRMLDEAIKKKVLYVVGSEFYPDNDNHESMRLNFTYSSDEKIVEGVRRLGKVFENAQK